MNLAEFCSEDKEIVSAKEFVRALSMVKMVKSLVDKIENKAIEELQSEGAWAKEIREAGYDLKPGKERRKIRDTMRAFDQLRDSINLSILEKRVSITSKSVEDALVNKGVGRKQVKDVMRLLLSDNLEITYTRPSLIKSPA